MHRILLASALALPAFAAAPVLADPSPAAPAPVTMPYPNTTTTDPGAAPDSGKGPSHKHLAGVKYEDRASPGAVQAGAGDAQVIEVQSVSWGKIDAAGTVYSADPMEGGQIAARKYAPGRPTFGNATFEGKNVASDPEEGGQVSAAKTGKPTVGEINVTKVKDVASSNLMSADTSGPGNPDAGVTGVSARTTATFKTLAKACTNGEHIKTALITAREGSYRLHDVNVIDVTPAGDGMETVTLTYASKDD